MERTISNAFEYLQRNDELVPSKNFSLEELAKLIDFQSYGLVNREIGSDGVIYYSISGKGKKYA